MERTCPLCNGFINDSPPCPTCQGNMENQGRLVDFMGDYIAYLDYEGTKLIDHDPDSLESHTCVHLFYCPECEATNNVSVKEMIR
ncbi:hypothetical protein [Aquibacillus kalidii]|uniref:hypothetical protein n=1 Tax=Aquibacillus kalidii TaxID=2762597 RepID=UPI00164477C4|nr:hypothetical protein [Aquibacillus kalidii]